MILSIILFNLAASLPCIDYPTVSNRSCDPGHAVPDCAYIESNQQYVCDNVMGHEYAVNADNCTLTGNSNNCTLYQGLVFRTPNQFCCNLSATMTYMNDPSATPTSSSAYFSRPTPYASPQPQASQQQSPQASQNQQQSPQRTTEQRPQPSSSKRCAIPTSLSDVALDCLNDPTMYNDFIQDLSHLHSNQTQQIFEGLKNQDPSEINDIIRQAGILTLNSLASGTPFTTSTDTFNYFAQHVPLNTEHHITISSFAMALPPFSNPNTAVSVIGWISNPYNTSKTVIDTRVVSISLSNISGSTFETQYLQTPLQLKWSASIANNDTRFTNTTFQRTCANSNETFVCPNANYTVQCIKDASLNFSCPSPTLSAECLYWNTSLTNWDTYGCYSVFFNSTYIICNCTHLTDFSARFIAVYQSNIALIQNAPSVYSVEGLSRYAHFYIVFGSLGALGLAVFCIGIFLDAADSIKYAQALTKNPAVRKFLEKGYLIDVCSVISRNQIEDEQQDHIVKPPSLMSVIWNRILFQHTHLAAFLRYDPRVSRLFRLQLIFVGLFNSLFLTAVLYAYTYADNVVSMTFLESIVLSAITATLNYPSLILLRTLINMSGLAEFKWRYPLLLDELNRRHNFENEVTHFTEAEIAAVNISRLSRDNVEISGEPSLWLKLNASARMYFEHISDALGFAKDKKPQSKGQMDKAFYYASKPYERPQGKPHYYMYLPFHTYLGASVFFVSIGWFIWTLNYLLLFAANHSRNVSDTILISFGFNELETVFLIQPLTLVFFILFGYVVRKVKACFKKQEQQSIPSLYYFSDPFVNPDSTTLSTEFAFDIFINTPSRISHTMYNVDSKTKNLGYASVQSVVDYLDETDAHYTRGSRDTQIHNLYADMNPLSKKSATTHNLFTYRKRMSITKATTK